jgi:hypothetical protein
LSTSIPVLISSLGDINSGKMFWNRSQN